MIHNGHCHFGHLLFFPKGLFENIVRPHSAIATECGLIFHMGIEGIHHE